jgi:TPP-dependent pyruvate/acetoin dehydrogenase alpha subunit
MGKATGLCKGKGGSMHIAEVDKGMLGTDGIGTLAVATGQIAAVSTGYGAVTIAGESQQNFGDVTADIGGSPTTSTVTGNVSKAIASLGKTWSGKNVSVAHARR